MTKTLISTLLLLLVLVSCGKDIENSETTEQAGESFGTQSSEDLISNRENLFNAIRSNDIFFLKYALTKTKDLNFQFKHSGETPLTEAIKASDLDIIVEILKQGEIHNLENKFFEIPLNLIIKSSRLSRSQKRDLVQSLFEKNININKKGLNGETPLQVAIEEKTKEIATILITRGASLEEKHNKGVDLADLAKRNRLESISKLIKTINENKDITVSNLKKAIRDQNRELLLYFLYKDPNLHLSIDKNNLLIDVLKIKRSEDRIQVLTFFITRLNASPSGAIGALITPLIFAANQKSDEYEKSIAYLVKNGADVYTKDRYGQTALDYVAKELSQKSLEHIYKKIVSENPNDYLSYGSRASRIIVSACQNIPNKRTAGRKIRNGKSVRKNILFTMKCP